MKLSEAIRLGAMMGPKANGVLMGAERSSCALGSAMLAVGANVLNGWSKFYDQIEWKWTNKVVKCPLCETKAPVINLIPHLNNSVDFGYLRCMDHNQTREWIAAWVATVEPQDIQETSPTSAPNYDCETCITGVNSCQSR